METCWKCGNRMELIKDKTYHYTESGLNNVYLTGIIQYKCGSCGESGVEIPQIKALHSLIARDIVCQKGLMAGDEVRFLRKGMRMKSKDIADALSLDPSTYSRWENGKQDVNPCHDKQMRLLYILNATEEAGRLIHKNIRAMMHSMATMPHVSRKIRLTPSEWLMRSETDPVFCEEAI